MKTAGRGTPNRWTIGPGNRAQDAVGQNRPDSIKGAAKVEKFQPRETCFFLTFPFIELIGSVAAGLLRCKWLSGRLSVGESIQGVCFHENLSPFIEKLATQ